MAAMAPSFLDTFSEKERAIFLETCKALENLGSLDRRKLILNWLKEITVDIPLLEQSSEGCHSREEREIIERRVARLSAVYANLR
jgi:hypothetical protein